MPDLNMVLRVPENKVDAPPQYHGKLYYVFIKTDYPGFLVAKVKKCPHACEKQFNFNSLVEKGDGLRLTIQGLESAQFLCNWASNHGYIRMRWLPLIITTPEDPVDDFDKAKLLISLQQHHSIPGNIKLIDADKYGIVFTADKDFLAHLLTMIDMRHFRRCLELELPRSTCEKEADPDAPLDLTKSNQFLVNVNFDPDEIRQFLNVYKVWDNDYTYSILYLGA